MTATAHPESTYRLAFVGLWALAAVSYTVLILLGHAPAGTVAFFALGVGAVVLRRSYGGPLFDERDSRILTTASANTMSLLGMASGVFFPVMATLNALGLYDWPAWLSPIALFVTALFLVWLGMILVVKYA